MKNKYFWPNRTAVVLLFLFFIISYIICLLVAHYSKNNSDMIILILLALSPCAALIILIMISFVKVTETSLIYCKYGFLHYKIEFSDITEWGSYNTCNKSGWFLYVTSIPSHMLRQGEGINQNVLKFKNRKRFILLNYDDKELTAFLNKNFPGKKGLLCRFSSYKQC